MVKLFFAGDFCSKPSTEPITVSNELRQRIASSDYSVVNFEVPLKPADAHLPRQTRERFFQHDDTVGFLKAMGFNLFQLANNHAFDFGEAGFLKTKAALGDAAFGAGTYDEAYNVKIVEKDGIRIGFMALCFAAYTGVFYKWGNHEGLGCAYINDMRVNHDIIEAKKKVDYLFILPHDGIEYIDIPMPNIIARYRDLIDYGADGVIATHPHCPQGWEEYKGKPIFYSLGNLFFNSKEGYDYRATNRNNWYLGLCVEMTIDDGKVSYQVVNTRNIDNLSIAIDTDSQRAALNDKLCRLISHKELYNAELRKVCHQLGAKEISVIDHTLHAATLTSVTKKAFSKWIKKMMGKKYEDDRPLQRLLDHDTRLELLKQTLAN